MINQIAKVAFILVLLYINSCGSVHYREAGNGINGDPLFHDSVQDEYSERVLSLKKDLEFLDNDIDEKEAFLIANTAIRLPMFLANQYELVSPPLLHNYLVNKGKKKRGLCFHWTKDLIKHLRGLDQKSFDFHYGIAYRDSLWRTHSSVIVTAKGHAFEDGIVLDPWRNSGRLYWTAVRKDRYPWQLEPNK